MSETPVYFLLAQLNAMMTGALRLALAAVLLLVLAWSWSLRPTAADHALPLARYFSGWVAGLGAVGLLAATALWLLLPYPNPFVLHGFWTGLGLILLASLLLGLQTRAFWQRAVLPRSLAALLLGLAWLACAWLPAFSRSDKTLLTALMALPWMLALAWFPVLFDSGWRWRQFFHGVGLISMLSGLLLHYGWLYPILSGIPRVGEFYPYINLYDWLLVLFMILYSGNVYVDYWLKQRASQLALTWHYPVVVTALCCQWLNTHIFDTLAL
ncbi:MAG: hypothetical protein IGS03_13200 [Candidatus Sericytochromatia bacterium]|nr:hypothetical protein [Candidatus Sericytochromatia bacterium]